MRLTREAALAIALIAGLLAAILAWTMFSKQKVGGAKEAPQTVLVAVPLQTVPVGAELRADMFQKKALEATQVPTNAIQDPQILEGLIAVTELPAGQPVRPEQVRKRSAQLGMAYALNEGLRAMAVSLDVVGTVADFIKPMDHVDILMVYRDNGHVVTRTLVQDVVVLAVGQTVTPPAPAQEEGAQEGAGAKAEQPRRAQTPVTLALTPQQAQLVLAADEAGDLRLTLRARNDRSIVPLAEVKSWTLVPPTPKQQQGQPAAQSQPSAAGQTKPAAPQAPAAAASGPKAGETAAQASAPPEAKLPRDAYVEVIRGSAREIVVPEKK